MRIAMHPPPPPDAMGLSGDEGERERKEWTEGRETEASTMTTSKRHGAWMRGRSQVDGGRGEPEEAE